MSMPESRRRGFVTSELRRIRSFEPKTTMTRIVFSELVNAIPEQL